MEEEGIPSKDQHQLVKLFLESELPVQHGVDVEGEHGRVGRRRAPTAVDTDGLS